MNGYLDTAFGVLKALPDVVQIGKDIWKQLKPPKQLSGEQLEDGVLDQTYYSADYKFAISVPDDQWEFWRPSSQFLAALGPMFILPTRAMPIVILSKQMVKLFRPTVNVIVESVGQYTNIDEMIQVSALLTRQADSSINDNDIHIDDVHQSGMIASSKPYLQDTLYQVQQYYLQEGMLYTTTASYVPISSFSKKLFGGLQEIMNSFKLIQP
jgi:hypothetical protein